MAIIELSCPHCHGKLEGEGLSELKFCPYCGKKAIVQETMTQKVEIDESSKTGKLVNLAFNEWRAGDNKDAKEHILQALEIDPMHSRAWILRSVIENSFRDCVGMKIQEGDLEFAINIIRERWSVGKVVSKFFPMNPEVNAFALLLENLEVVERRWMKKGQICIDLFEDELETGFERFCDKPVKALGNILDAYGKLPETLKVNCPNVVEFGERLALFSAMKNEIKNSFFVPIKDEGELIDRFSREYTFNGIPKKLKELKNGKITEIELDAGIHNFMVLSTGTKTGFKHGFKRTILYLPKMPEAIFCNPNEAISVYKGNGKIVHSFRLKNYPDYYVNVTPRDTRRPVKYNLEPTEIIGRSF